MYGPLPAPFPTYAAFNGALINPSNPNYPLADGQYAVLADESLSPVMSSRYDVTSGVATLDVASLDAYRRGRLLRWSSLLGAAGNYMTGDQVISVDGYTIKQNTINANPGNPETVGSGWFGIQDDLDFNLLDPKWGIVQKLMSATPSSVRAEIQSVLDFAEASHAVSGDYINKARVYAPGAQYCLDGTLYVPNSVDFEGEPGTNEYGLKGSVLCGLPGFNGGGGDLVRVKPGSGSGSIYWSGGFQYWTLIGAADGSVAFGFNTKDIDDNDIELQDTASVDFLFCQYLAAGGVRLYGGVPNYIRRLRPFCCNGPGLTIVANSNQHTITHIQEISGDQCNGGLVRYESMSDDCVLVITTLKSERASPLLTVGTSSTFYTTIAGWKNAGHDGQKNAITFNNPTGGRVQINGGHHISAYNTQQTCTFSGSLFTVATNSDIPTGATIRFTSTGTLPTGIAANTDYYWNAASANTGNIATSAANLASGIYVTPTGGSGTLSIDGGYLTAGDMIAVLGGSTSFPSIQYNGCYIRYRPYATGGVEKIGTKPNIISNVPAGNNTGGSPRLVNFPVEQPFGEIMPANAGRSFVGTAGSSNAIRPSRVLVGGTSYPVSNLNEDGVVGVIGNLPAFLLYENDAPANQHGLLLRANSGSVIFSFIDDSGNFYNLISLTRNSDGTANSVSIADGKDIQTGTTTGTRIGVTTTQKLGFYGSTPSIQRANANQAAVSGSAGSTYTSAEQAIINGQTTLLNEIRTVLVNLGLMKGSA